jgi:hypothetical protein
MSASDQPVGNAVNLTALLPAPETVTVTFPDVAMAGTGATILVALQVVGVACVPLNSTKLQPCVAPKFTPVIVTEVPVPPCVGDTLFILGSVPFEALKAAMTATHFNPEGERVQVAAIDAAED